MVNLFPNNSIVRINNGIIEEITQDARNTLLTVTYVDWDSVRRNERRIILVIGNNTTILNENGFPVPARTLRVGMFINAVVSAAMTRSIPPQTSAFLIRIAGRPLPETMITTGRIQDIDRQNRNFTTIQNRNPNSAIQFNVPEDAAILNRNGGTINFSRLMPGMHVRVRHASFMTASLPPQTTAFEIQVL